jgi:hypothetical protein
MRFTIFFDENPAPGALSPRKRLVSLTRQKQWNQVWIAADIFNPFKDVITALESDRLRTIAEIWSEK